MLDRRKYRRWLGRVEMRGRQIKKRKADLERKLRSDLEQEEEEQRESGMSPEEVRYAARGAFGNANPIRKQTH
jgi:hypothetical protein